MPARFETWLATFSAYGPPHLRQSIESLTGAGAHPPGGCRRVVGDRS